MTDKVLVLDGRSRAALQIVRSLGSRGIDVAVGNEDWFCSSFFSRYAKKRLVYPNPQTEDFKDFMFNAVEKSGFDAIFPVRDETTLFCAKYKKELSEYTAVPVADYDTIMKGRDKSKTVEEAERLGVPVPKTEVVEDTETLMSLDLDYPVVLKPAFSSGSRGLYKVDSAEQLKELSDSLFTGYSRYLVQEFIPSERTVGVNVLFDGEGEKAVFTYERLREYPRMGGPSVLRVSTDDQQVKDLAVKLFRGLKWFGVAMAEFKVDSRDGTPKLMEVNPRFWGSLRLSVYAGVDFPHLLHRVAKGERIDPVTDYRVGVKARWLLLGDLLWMLKSRNRWGDFNEFLRFFERNQTYDILSLSDPLPSAGAILESFQFIFNPRKRKHAFGRGGI